MIELEKLLEMLYKLGNEYSGSDIDKTKLNVLLRQLRERYKQDKKIFNKKIINTINEIKQQCYKIDNIHTQNNNKNIFIKQNELIDKEVKHKIFGDGKITYEDNTKLKVVFNIGGETIYSKDALKTKVLILIEHNKSVTEFKIESDKLCYINNYGEKALICNLQLLYSNVRELKYYIRAIKCYDNMNFIEEAKILTDEALRIYPMNKELLNYYEVYKKLSYRGGHYKIKDKNIQAGTFDIR